MNVGDRVVMLRTVTRDPAQTAYRLAGGEHLQPVEGEVVEVHEGHAGRAVVRARLGFPFYRAEWFAELGDGRLHTMGPNLPEVEDALWPEDAPEVAERRDAADKPARDFLHDPRRAYPERAGHHFPRAGTHDVVPLAPGNMARYL